ncbi:hypothetical protein H2201_008814 [Coniosporium apollinis]|uniref:Uncharacterized protein n=1 Tax=Coniosporium apollinis TaxID=61459 RepID=A0ABQ9NHP1_9PEZI|nr:hypothetical protein H2201_008814 [Coniosporium apollinis]
MVDAFNGELRSALHNVDDLTAKLGRAVGTNADQRAKHPNDNLPHDKDKARKRARPSPSGNSDTRGAATDRRKSSSRHSSSSTTRKTSTNRKLPEYCALAGDRVDKGPYINSDGLPSAVQSAIEEMLERRGRADEAYRRLDSRSSLACVELLTQGSSGDYLYSKADGRNASCRRCVHSSRPCLVRVRDRKAHKRIRLVAVPLPKALREGKSNKDKAHWIAADPEADDDVEWAMLPARGGGDLFDVQTAVAPGEDAA